MVRIQRLPFVIPKNTRFSTESIHIDSTGYSYDEDRFFGCGTSLFFDKELYKYVVTFRVDKLVIDLFLFSLPSNTGDMQLYPVMIKFYDPSKPPEFHNKNTLLLKSGINNLLNIYTDSGNVGNYRFIVQDYIAYAIKSCYPETFTQYGNVDALSSHESLTEVDFREYDTNINLLNYVNNEGNPTYDFSFDNFINNLQLGYYRFPADPSRHIDLASSTIFDTLCPEIPTAILRNKFLVFCMRNGMITSSEFLMHFQGSQIESSDSIYEDPTIVNILEQSDKVTYSCCLDNRNSNEEIDITFYSFYETLQRLPITDGFIRYILHNEGDLLLDSGSYVSNYYINYLNNKLDINNFIVSEIGREIDPLLQFNVFNERTMTISVIVRDYHVLVIVKTITNKQWTIVFDLVALGLLSKTLMLTDRYNYL